MSMITPELIKAAREWKYHSDEGFLDDAGLMDFNGISPHVSEGVMRLAEELSVAAKVPVNLAVEVVINFMLEKYLQNFL